MNYELLKGHIKEMDVYINELNDQITAYKILIENCEEKEKICTLTDETSILEKGLIAKINKEKAMQGLNDLTKAGRHCSIMMCGAIADLLKDIKE